MGIVEHLFIWDRPIMNICLQFAGEQLVITRKVISYIFQPILAAMILLVPVVKAQRCWLGLFTTGLLVFRASGFTRNLENALIRVLVNILQIPLTIRCCGGNKWPSWWNATWIREQMIKKESRRCPHHRVPNINACDLDFDLLAWTPKSCDVREMTDFKYQKI